MTGQNRLKRSPHARARYDTRQKLDRIDIKILAELQKNGNITNANLANAVGLSPSPCLQRVKRLESSGIISGYGVHLNLAKLTTR